jgi:pyruvate/2-oxoglutarate dehydrogenase complex dihydrolipoamide dehydrogenase (E3) component
MPHHDYDIAIVGAGSGGLTAARFAAQLGARVALIEKHRIGGDCTWTGCVPSKALLKVAKVAHEARTASHYGVTTSTPAIDMAGVRDYVRAAIQQVYQFETPDALQREGVDVILGAARFLDRRTLSVGERSVRSKAFLLTTGAHPVIPPIAGLSDVPFQTYEQIFDNDKLPRTMVVIGGGPIGMELAQAYQRLGAQVTVIADRILPKEDQEVRELMQRVFEREGVRFVWGRAKSAHKNSDGVVVETDGDKALGELLLVASGRKPSVAGLDLERAGVTYSAKGIPVDKKLRTNVKNIYAAGDVAGGYQFTHFAGWQAFQAVRNALLPGTASGFTDLVPQVTFTDPEVAHVGSTTLGDDRKVWRWDMARTDRAICENDRDGFIKVVARKNGVILGATIVGARAGETITELIIAIGKKMKAADLAGAIHAYPTYSTAVQQLAADMTIQGLLAGTPGRLIRWLSSHA